MLTSTEAYEDWLIQKIAAELGISADSILTDQPLSAMGLNSQQFIALSGEMEELLGIRLNPTIVFEYPTIQAIASHLSSLPQQKPVSTQREMDFSLFFFSVLDSGDRPYDLIEKAALFADENSFHGLWVPERHFHKLGGASPSPALLCAALSQKTTRLRLKAGSVVAPLQDAVRIVEDWSMVDQLSQGRIELSLASGWHVDDFALAPGNYEHRKEILYQRFHEIQKLWSGQGLDRINGHGNKISVSTFPKPVQKKLPLWITAIGNIESFEKAGQSGAHLLTCLLSQDIQELATKIKIYRKSLKDHGHGPRKVAVFIHTFVAETNESAKMLAEGPFKDYLRSTLDLLGNFGLHQTGDLKMESFSEEQRISLLNFAFERYFSERSLIGSPQKCQDVLKKLKAADVDEVACLVDFGVEASQVMRGLQHLADMKETFIEMTRDLQ